MCFCCLQPIIKNVKPKAGPVPRAQLECKAARKGPYGAAPAPGSAAEADAHDPSIPPGMIMRNGILVPTAARKGSYGKAPASRAKGPALKPAGAGECGISIQESSTQYLGLLSVA